MSADIEEILQTIKDIRRYRTSALQRYVNRAVSPTGSSATLKEVKSRATDRYQDLERLEESILEYTRERCFRSDREQAYAKYAGFVKTVANSDVPVFTTNYDYVLDDVAQRLDIPVVDNFKPDNTGRRFWDPSLRCFSKDGLRIVKLHGSVQWYVDEAGEIEKIRYRADMNPEGRRLENLVIFPTRFKDIYEQHYFSLYRLFLRALGRADVIFIIGHSLRDQYIRAAIRERVRRGSVKAVVIDPGDPKLEDIVTAAASGPAEAIVRQFKWEIGKVAPLIGDAIARIEPESIVPYLGDAESRLRKSRVHFDSVGVEDAPQWIGVGEQLELGVELETTVGGGRFEIWLDVGRQEGNRRLLEWETVKGDGVLEDVENIRGVWDADAIVQVQIPHDIPVAGHTLGVGLLGLEGEVVVKREYKVRTRKN